MSETITDGVPTYAWEAVARRKCRIDTQFVAGNRGAPMIIEAGRVPDRVGTAWFSAGDLAVLRPGDRIRCVAGPITGTFSLDELPDQCGDFSGLHHLEFGIKEVAQQIAQVGE